MEESYTFECKECGTKFTKSFWITERFGRYCSSCNPYKGRKITAGEVPAAIVYASHATDGSRFNKKVSERHYNEIKNRKAKTSDEVKEQQHQEQKEAKELQKMKS